MKAKRGEVSFAGGVRLDFRFPDENNLLETAYSDFKRFLQAGKIPLNGSFRITSEKANDGIFESYRIEVSDNLCKVLSNDTEGIRRGFFFLEDEILRSGGPFLKKGFIERKPHIRTRLSRCFFGPIKRPPMNRDELADDVDYYPEEYLNRLAHEGINGLWITVSFSDLCRTRFFPSHGREAGKRLEKLSSTVKKCARYGIKIYLFCIEPRGFGSIPAYLLPEEELVGHEYFRGHQDGNFTYFCTSSREGLEYLTDCTRSIFSSVPGLGGLIDINLGERPTHCYSSINTLSNNNCPRCSKRKPWDVFRDTVSALAAGMQDVNPRAEMISWLYVPAISGRNGSDVKQTEDIIREIAAHMPREVVFQYNFESGGKDVQLGKERAFLDYWLAWPGPSDIFKSCAGMAEKTGARVSAKIQTGCSHEVATVPFVPVPGNLYRKYSAMKALNVSSVMQCWYFGNYPGIMNKSAGELSFEPFFDTEDGFLMHLAKADWGINARKVVRAWKSFRDGYSNFPYNLSFAWYGPVHNSVVWPLHLEPVDKPISPSWKFTFPLVSGDRIGECLCYDHTLEEALVLLKEMSAYWSRGVKILETIANEYRDNPERRKDIGLAKALNIQINSALNVFRFYAFREELPYCVCAGKKKLLMLMKDLAEEEIRNSVLLKELCEEDPRLGFHSEAEGYKYDPRQLENRVRQIKDLIRYSFPLVERDIESGKPLFPVYTGVKPEGKNYTAGRDKKAGTREKLNDGETSWICRHDDKSLYFEVECSGKGTAHFDIKIEPRRLWPAQTFSVGKNGYMRHGNFKTTGDQRWKARVSRSGNGWKALVTIPFEIFEGFYDPGRPMRVNIIRGGFSWAGLNPLEARLRFGADNPADLGWLFFAGQRRSPEGK